MVNPYQNYGVSDALYQLAQQLEEDLQQSEAAQRLRRIRENNQIRVLEAFRCARISEAGFGGGSGYGYDDLGRDRLEQAFADIMGAEKACFRVQISSGTQAIAMGFFSCLRPGDLLLAGTGLPYDTLMESIGVRQTKEGLSPVEEDLGSLYNFGVSFDCVELLESGLPDEEGVLQKLEEAKQVGKPVKMLHLQRSRGYSQRAALTKTELEPLIRRCKAISPETVIFVDNCYGEFTDESEPNHWGADLCAGSLIKNPGGGLAPTGGYLCGRADLVELAASRMTAPGIGTEIGPSLGYNRQLTQGLYLAPHVVMECLQGLVFAARLCAELGVKTEPSYDAVRGDIIQTFQFETATELIQFCQSVQAASPVDAFVEPQPALLPGYQDEVIMAAGAFVQGSSIELSADGPIRVPYTAYLQGGLVYEQVKLAILMALSRMGKLG